MGTKLMDVVLGVFARFEDERGQALSEYGLVLALIAVVGIVALTALGVALAGKLSAVTTGMGA